MEFFEQAHVARSSETAHKSRKPEETVKKQLKQMMYGYKNSGNQLIKISMDMKADCDDSSSVSGFSDLSLTESSCVADTTRATIGSPDSIDSILDDLNIDASPEVADLPADSDNESCLSESHESLTVEVSSTSEDNLLDSDEIFLQNQEEVSLVSGSVKTISDTESSQEFDPDGVLASKILEKLKNNNEKSKVTKRPLEQFEEQSRGNSLAQKAKLTNRKCKKSKVSESPKVLHPRLTDGNFNENSDDILLSQTLEGSPIESPVLSPPYVSISAEDMHQDKFDDLLGEYRHSTIKNIPFDNDDHIFSGEDSIFYSAKVMTVDEMDMDEEITDLTENYAQSTSSLDKRNEMQDEIALESSKDIQINDSIENIDDTLQSQDGSETLEDSIKLLFQGNVCVCVMKHPGKFYINGKCKVQCLAGNVEIFGFTLSDQSYEVYSPYTNFAQCLSTVEKDSTFYGLFGKLTKLGVSVSVSEDIVTGMRQYDAIIVMEPLKSVKMNFVEKYFSVANLFTKSSKHVDHCHVKALQRLDCSVYMAKPRKTFEVPLSWREVDKYCMKEQSRGIICGGKGVGKSTCLRYNVNRLLAHGPVLVIDLDIGQSEFTVAGNISASVVSEPLLGPNFTHLRKPDRTLNLGMINPLDNMKRYVNAVVRLIGHCAADDRLRSMRWIVNTMGLCNTVGLHLLTITILHCQPNYVLQIDSKNVKKRFDMFLRPHLVSAHYAQHKNMPLFKNTTCPDNLDYGFILTHHTEGTAKNTNSLAPRDERYLNFLAYFSDLLTINRGSTLLAITPYEVQLQDLCVYMNVKIPEGTVSQVLNGKIVALCQNGLGSDIKKTYVLADEPLLCHGHGLIRGIDFDKGILYVITPMSVDWLQVVDTLLYADWVPELRGQEAQLPAGLAVPYRTPAVYQQKQLMFSPRRRFNPVQLLKMSRGS